MHISLINGVEDAVLPLYKGGADTVKVHLLDLDGAPINTTGNTPTLEFYADADRRAAALDSIAVPLTIPTAGYGVIAITEADITATQGKYFGFIKYVTAGGVIGWSRIPFTVVVK